MKIWCMHDHIRSLSSYELFSRLTTTYTHKKNVVAKDLFRFSLCVYVCVCVCVCVCMCVCAYACVQCSP